MQGHQNTYKMDDKLGYSYAAFTMFGAFYFWIIGKMTGLAYPKTSGQINFWLMFLGVNLTFFPMHFLGLAVCLVVFLIIRTPMLVGTV